MARHGCIAVIIKLLEAAKNKSAFLVVIIQPLVIPARIQPDKPLSPGPAKSFRPGHDLPDITSSPEDRIGDNPVQINGRICVSFVPDHPVCKGSGKTTGYLPLLDHLPV